MSHSHTVLFAGGPLHGTTMVTDSTMGVYAMDNYRPVSLDDPLPEPVRYSLARFALCGRIVWIGYLGTRPDDDLVFDVLTSGEAKEATVPR